jgi:protein-S-isoprenylcysteine O-methyltransferase Ste14
MTSRALGLFAGLRALVYMTGFVLLWGWLALEVRRYDSSLSVALPPWAPTLAVAVIGLGAAVVLMCAGFFAARGRGTPAPFDAPRKVVATGPYRWVRNPMYIGAFLVLGGFGLWHRSVSILLLAGFGILLAHSFVVFFEEPDLERRFGDSYRRYKDSVNRWLPRRPGM